MRVVLHNDKDIEGKSYETNAKALNIEPSGLYGINAYTGGLRVEMTSLGLPFARRGFERPQGVTTMQNYMSNGSVSDNRRRSPSPDFSMLETKTNNGQSSEKSAAISLGSSMTHNAYTRSKMGRDAVDRLRQNTKHAFDYSNTMGGRKQEKLSKRELNRVLD